MRWLRKICEWTAAAAIAAATVISAGTAFSRYVFASTPTWTEPVMILLVLFAVALAVGPGLQDGAHVAIRFLADRLSRAGQRILNRFVDCATLVLGLAIFSSGAVYTADLFDMGFTDYAGIPQWVQAALASVFGGLLAIYSFASLRHPEWQNQMHSDRSMGQ